MMMTRTKWSWSLIVLSVCLTCSITTYRGQAQAELYVGVMGGGAFPNDFSDVEGKGLLAGTSFGDLALESSGMVGGKLGYFFPKVKWLGVETEVFYARPNFKNQSVLGAGPGGTSVLVTQGLDLDVVTWAINALVRYPGKRFQPYGGLGLGIFFADLGSSSDNGVPGMNALAGARYLVTQHFVLFAEYKYNRASFKFDNSVLTGGGLGDLEGDYSTNMIAVGLGYSF